MSPARWFRWPRYRSLRSPRRATAGPQTTGLSEEVVLFPFDDRSIPFTYGLSYNLVQGRRRGVVLRPAESGPDSQHIINHGSVLRVDGEFRIWYLCSGDHDPSVRDLDDPGPPSLDDDYNPRKWTTSGSTTSAMP